MGESSSEMSAEEMTEALTLEEKPEAPSSGEKLEDSEAKPEAASSPLNGEAVSLEGEPDTAKGPSPTEQDEEQNENPLYKFMDKDPIDLVPYIEKYVTIQLERNYSYAGFVHSIDPISRSVILSVPKEGGRYQTTFIPGTSVLQIMESQHNGSIIPPKRKNVAGLFSPEVQLRKKKIISWLKENHLPVTEEGENVLFGGVTLLPPYEEKDICTTNPIVALEIKKIIGRMPADYQPK